MAGSSRFTEVPQEGPASVSSDVSGQVHSFRSNIDSTRHFVAVTGTLTEPGDVLEEDGQVTFYVTGEQARELAEHFESIALEQGGYVFNRLEVYQNGYKDGRNGESEIRRQNAISYAERLRQLADELQDLA